MKMSIDVRRQTSSLGQMLLRVLALRLELSQLSMGGVTEKWNYAGGSYAGRSCASRREEFVLRRYSLKKRGVVHNRGPHGGSKAS